MTITQFSLIKLFVSSLFGICLFLLNACSYDDTRLDGAAKQVLDMRTDTQDYFSDLNGDDSQPDLSQDFQDIPPDLVNHPSDMSDMSLDVLHCETLNSSIQKARPQPEFYSCYQMQHHPIPFPLRIFLGFDSHIQTSSPHAMLSATVTQLSERHLLLQASDKNYFFDRQGVSLLPWLSLGQHVLIKSSQMGGYELSEVHTPNASFFAFIFKPFREEDRNEIIRFYFPGDITWSEECSEEDVSFQKAHLSLDEESTVLFTGKTVHLKDWLITLVGSSISKDPQGMPYITAAMAMIQLHQPCVNTPK